MDILSFKRPKKNKLKSFLISIILLMFLGYLLFDALQKEHIISIVLISVFILLSLKMLFDALMDKATVIVDSDGIRNNTNGMGLIRWQYIIDFEIKTILRNELLVVNVRDSELLLNEKNLITKVLMKANVKKLGSPVIISEKEFDSSLLEVIERIETYKNNLHIGHS